MPQGARVCLALQQWVLLETVASGLNWRRQAVNHPLCGDELGKLGRRQVRPRSRAKEIAQFTRLGFRLTLRRYRRGGGRNFGRIAKVVATDGTKVVGQFVNQRHRSWDIEMNDRLIGDMIEMFD